MTATAVMTMINYGNNSNIDDNNDRTNNDNDDGNDNDHNGNDNNNNNYNNDHNNDTGDHTVQQTLNSSSLVEPGPEDSWNESL